MPASQVSTTMLAPGYTRTTALRRAAPQRLIPVGWRGGGAVPHDRGHGELEATANAEAAPRSAAAQDGDALPISMPQ